MTEIIEFLQFDIFNWGWNIIVNLGKFLTSMFAGMVRLISLIITINPIIAAIFIIMLIVGIFMGILKLIKLIPIL